MTTEQTIRQKLEWYGMTTRQPPGGIRGYRNLLLEASAEINRLEGLQAAVTCMLAVDFIERLDHEIGVIAEIGHKLATDGATRQ